MRKIQLDDVYKLWDTAGSLATDYIRQEARTILQGDNNLNEFIMGMGACFFTAKQEGLYDITKYSDNELIKIDENNGLLSDNNLHMADSFQPDFMDIINELNDKFNSMGFPMRFTANGKEENDW